jgi:hypothetical protein
MRCDARIEVSRLGAEGAVFGTITELCRKDGAEGNTIAVKVSPYFVSRVEEIVNLFTFESKEL